MAESDLNCFFLLKFNFNYFSQKYSSLDDSVDEALLKRFWLGYKLLIWVNFDYRKYSSVGVTEEWDVQILKVELLFSIYNEKWFSIHRV